jgi:4-hydroxy-tetrahydrodipicolinate synthase
VVQLVSQGTAQQDALTDGGRLGAGARTPERAAATAPARGVKRYAGVNASMALPMTADFQPDVDALRFYARWLADQGVVGVTVNADTGEGAHLTLAERVKVVEVVKGELADDVTVVSGLIASHTAQAVEVATALRDAGADGLLVFSIPAFTGAPLPAAVVYDYFAAVSEVGLPLISFNLTPALGGVVYGADVIRRLATLTALHGLKEASFDAAAYVASRDAVREAAADIAFLSGCDNFMCESFVLGADGALLGYAGLAAELTCEVFESVRGHRYGEAQTLSRERMQPLAKVLFGAPMRNSRARIKEGLRLLGIIGDATVRPPLPALDGAERSAVRSAMQAAGLL